MSTYPNKEEILLRIKHHPPNKIDTTSITDWKKTYYSHRWKKATTKEKQEAIQILLRLLWYTYIPPNPPPKVIWLPLDSWSYSPETHIITGTNPSIISALHELGHAIYGESELQACAYSTALFQTCFPKEYGRLTWEGHMLTKRINN